MASEQSYNATDLTSVLSTLSSLTSQSTQTRHDDAQSEVSSKKTEQQHRPFSKTPDTRQPSSKDANDNRDIDPASITTWPAALRYVMHTVAQNEETQLRIRGLIRSQHHHERQWWEGREALLKKQAARGQKKKELDAVLQSVGAPVDPNDITTPEQDRTELSTYVLKVYKASAQMADAMTAELRGMGIPFFVLRASLIRDGGPGSGSDASSSASSTLTREEVGELRRRMLELLLDLCKE